jgi:enoyl-CoA hydratase
LYRQGGVATIVLNRPETLNALDVGMLDALSDAWDEVERDPAIAVVIITGVDGRAFSAGADLKSALPLVTDGGLEAQVVGPVGGAFAKGLPTKPVIAAVRGVCVAGGTELLQATDIRIASEDAVFGLPEPKWGLFPAGGSTARLPRQIPFCHAMEILLTGRMVSAHEAFAMGLINRIVPPDEVLENATRMAELIARNGSAAVQAIKRAALESLGRPLEESFAIESGYARKVFATADAVEGPRAFVEKREPRFRNGGPDWVVTS